MSNKKEYREIIEIVYAALQACQKEACIISALARKVNLDYTRTRKLVTKLEKIQYLRVLETGRIGKDGEIMAYSTTGKGSELIPWLQKYIDFKKEFVEVKG